MIDRKLIDDCVHCGFCLPACPTYQSWNEEMDSPRGRIYLMRALAEGKPLSDAMATHFDRCLGCMACVTACPSGVKYDHLIMQTRAVVEKQRRSLPDRLFRSMLFALFPHPRRLRFLLPFQALIPRRISKLTSLTPPITAHHLFAKLPVLAPAQGPRRARVALLAGCVQRVYFPNVNEATIRVLNAEGCDVVVPPSLGCCGALSAHAGRAEEAQRFANDAIEVLEKLDVDAIVTNAAGCGSWMKEWPRLASKVRDISEFLVALGPAAPRRPLHVRIAYHDACHLAHAQRIRAQPRALLAAIPGVELIDIPDGDTCCGSAGIYNLVEPESAREIGARKVENILSVNPQLLVSANPGCTLQIGMLMRERGVDIPAAHVVEVVDASIRNGTLTDTP
ncbi:MAG TPA: heterodisulfide reductase-related iron-sulfur binding cluster [Thermoanaerobaculia bacterium]|nr:heterodisulfide reductase-related iron-sulfur binding cluster [Thermoanaerobaculia bacterium]